MKRTGMLLAGTLALALGAQANLAGQDKGKAEYIVTPQDQPAIAIHPGGVCCVVFSPDGNMLASTGYDGTVRLWNVSNGKEILRLVGQRPWFQSVAYSPDGRMLAVPGEGNAVKLHDVPTGKEQTRFSGHGSAVHSLVFAHDGKTLATMDSAYVNDTIHVWNLMTGKQQVTLKKPSSLYAAMTFAPDDKSLFIARQEHNSTAVTVLDPTTGPKKTLHLQHKEGEIYPVYCVALSADCRWCATGHGAELSRFLNSGELEKEKGIFVVMTRIIDVTRSAGNVKLWDLTEGKERYMLKGHRVPVMDVAFAPDARTLASADENGMVKLWEPATGRQLASFQAATDSSCRLSFSPDGKTLATGGGGEGAIKLWQVAPLVKPR